MTSYRINQLIQQYESEREELRQKLMRTLINEGLTVARATDIAGPPLSPRPRVNDSQTP